MSVSVYELAEAIDELVQVIHDGERRGGPRVPLEQRDLDNDHWLDDLMREKDAAVAAQQKRNVDAAKNRRKWARRRTQGL